MLHGAAPAGETETIGCAADAGRLRLQLAPEANGQSRATGPRGPDVTGESSHDRSVTIFLPLLLLLAWCAWGVARLVRERRQMRQARISDARPACARCLYPLGGWTSPSCPECGIDVRREGVRVAPRGRALAVTIALVALTILLVTPLTLLLSNRLFQESTGQQSILYEIRSMPGTFVGLDVRAQSRQLPPQHELMLTIRITVLPPEATGTWVNDRWQGSAPLHLIAICSVSREDLPTARVLEAALMEAAMAWSCADRPDSEPVSDTTVAGAAERIAAAIAPAWDMFDSTNTMLVVNLPMDRFRQVSSTLALASGVTPLALLSSLVFVLSVVLFAWYASERATRHWYQRRVRDDEWRDAGGTTTVGAAPLK